MAQAVSISQCKLRKPCALKVLTGSGTGWYGQLIGAADNSPQIRFVVENSLLPKESRGLNPGDEVEVATVWTPESLSWGFPHSDVLVDSVVYKHGTVFMIRMLRRAEKGNSNGE